MADSCGSFIANPRLSKVKVKMPMANPLDMIKYLFGVTIVPSDESLYIEDRRPAQGLGFSMIALVVVGSIVGWGWLTRNIIFDEFTIALTAVPVVVTLYFLVKNNFREIYIFNITTDSFSFSRQSLFRNDVLEGSASQFRAVQVLKRTADDRDITELVADQFMNTDNRSGRVTYSAALMCQGPLFGQSDTQILRESPPLLSLRRTERRIAAAIAKFLNIPSEGIIDVL
jgi:hypothetical protein